MGFLSWLKSNKNKLLLLFFFLIFILLTSLLAHSKEYQILNNLQGKTKDYSSSEPGDYLTKTVQIASGSVKSEQDLEGYLSDYYSDNFIKLAFAGDFMFDRSIRAVANKKGNDYILKEIKSLLEKKDLVVVNLEGPITDYDSVSINTQVGENNHMVFTFDESLAETLKKHNVRMVNLGNNHILNFGKQGLNQTKVNLEKNGIKYFGNTGLDNDTLSYEIVEFNNLKIGFVNYNQFVSGAQESALEDIKAVRPKVDILILYTHWGNEYQKLANKVIQDLAHTFVDNGVDLIIGSHPHVIQQVEEYKGKKIYYSLGNFVFDQYFSEETMKGMILEVNIDPLTKQLDFNERFVYLNPNGQTQLVISDQ